MLVHQVELLPFLQRERDVLRLQVSVDQPADPVHVVERHKELLCDLAHSRQWDSSVVIFLYEREQVLAQDLEGHHEVFAVEAVVEEPVVHLEAVGVLSGHYKGRGTHFLREILLQGLAPSSRLVIVCDAFADGFLVKGTV